MYHDMKLVRKVVFLLFLCKNLKYVKEKGRALSN